MVFLSWLWILFSLRNCSLGSSDIDFSLLQDWWSKAENKMALETKLNGTGFKKETVFGNITSIGYEEAWVKNNIKVSLPFSLSICEFFICYNLSDWYVFKYSQLFSPYIGNVGQLNSQIMLISTLKYNSCQTFMDIFYRICRYRGGSCMGEYIHEVMCHYLYLSK